MEANRQVRVRVAKPVEPSPHLILAGGPRAPRLVRGEGRGQSHVPDLHLHADVLEVALDEQLHVLEELIASVGRVREAEALPPLRPNTVGPNLPARLLEPFLRLLRVLRVRPP